MHGLEDCLPVKNAITIAYAGGTLRVWLLNALRGASDSDREAIFTQVVQLHQAGEIDALGALLDPGAEWNWSQEWRARQQMLADLIPRLATSVNRMIAAIDAVGAETVRYLLDEAFLSWCRADSNRPAEIIALLHAGTDIADRFVLAALIAGFRTEPDEYLRTCAAIAKGERPGSRNVGARALGQMPQTDDGSVACAVQALKSVMENRDIDGQTRAVALSAAIDIAVRVPEAPAEQFIELLRKAPDDNDTVLLETCAEIFGRHATRLPIPLQQCMSEVLPKLNSERMQAFDFIDMGLYELLSGSADEEQATQLIEALVRREDGDLVFARLDGTRHELSNGNDLRLSRVVVRWLLTGEAALCQAAAKLVTDVHRSDLSLAADFVEFPLTDSAASFLARKAIGWFLLRPTTVTSLIVSLLGQVTDAGVEPLGDLLFDPMLMNYPGSVRRQLETVVPALSGAALKTIERILAKDDAYVRGINATGNVPELHQSERNRRIEFQRQNDEFSVARREAEKQSVLLSIAHKVQLLHGTRTVSYVDDFSGGTRRLDNKLGHISTEMEQPMQWTFDPLGLEYKLLAFRAERSP